MLKVVRSFVRQGNQVDGVIETMIVAIYEVPLRANWTLFFPPKGPGGCSWLGPCNHGLGCSSHGRVCVLGLGWRRKRWKVDCGLRWA